MRFRMHLFAWFLVSQQVMVGVVGRQLTGTSANTVNKVTFTKVDSTLGYPVSPFISDTTICKNLANQPSYTVNGYPSSPVNWQPFTLKFKQPSFAERIDRVCRDDGHCMNHYEFDVLEVGADLGCKVGGVATKTVFLAYGGTVPGPTLFVPEGDEILVRFNSKLKNGLYGQNHHPCGSSGRGPGLPISTHCHGQASLAPFDGWAENLICADESKVYVYPNNRAGTGWYHDHSLDITASNAYRGLAGFYLISRKNGLGHNCGEPWNLDDIPDYHIIIGDKLLDTKCQLRMDELEGQVHHDNFYGDANVVSGVPWPVLTVHPAYTRFRMLIGGPTRPYKLHLVDTSGKSIGGQILDTATNRARCQIIGGDGGFREAPVNFPAGGLFMGVAERYEFVCDLTDMGGKTLFVWNSPDTARTTGDVPFFCYTHLLMKIMVLPNCPSSCAFSSTPLTLRANGDYQCGTSSGQNACCPDGQVCSPIGSGANKYFACRSKPVALGYLSSEASCYLQAAPQKVGTDVLCGGTSFGDNGKDAAQACCPENQFCWHKSSSEWLCKPKPAVLSTWTESVGSASACTLPKPNFGRPSLYLPTIDKVITDQDYKAAVTLAESGGQHRTFKFGKSNGEWVINGKTWHTQVIQASDVGENTWEVWRLETGGGWFHPIHIHLIDFWVIRRDGPIKAVETYENRLAKDVVALHPSGTVWLMARFGPHKGDYMFHCHNLRHEDNAMMAAFSVKNTEQGLTKATATSGGIDFLSLNSATGIVYDTYSGAQNFANPMSQPATPTVLLPDGKTKPLDTDTELRSYLRQDFYRIFFPSQASCNGFSALCDTAANPWIGTMWKTGLTCPVY